jgi:hypothetical protein
MKNGICPKCGSTAVFHGPSGSVATGWSYKDAALLPLTMMRGAGLTNYVCTDCGYLERYVDAAADLTAIAENWDKVGGQDANSPEAGIRKR